MEDRVGAVRPCGSDWLTFDEGYGGKPESLRELTARAQNWVAEVPKTCVRLADSATGDLASQTRNTPWTSGEHAANRGRHRDRETARPAAASLPETARPTVASVPTRRPRLGPIGVGSQARHLPFQGRRRPARRSVAPAGRAPRADAGRREVLPLERSGRNAAVGRAVASSCLTPVPRPKDRTGTGPLRRPQIQRPDPSPAGAPRQRPLPDASHPAAGKKRSGPCLKFTKRSRSSSPPSGMTAT